MLLMMKVSELRKLIRESGQKEIADSPKYYI